MYCDNKVIEETVSVLTTFAENEYDFAVAMTENIYKVKEAFCLAKYKVETLLPAPTAGKLEAMPRNFSISYLKALREAGTAVGYLRNVIDDIVSKYFEIDDTTSTAVPVYAELTDKMDNPPNKRVKVGRGSTVGDVIKSKLEGACESYEKARQILIQDIKKHEKMMEIIIGDTVHREDEVLFNVRGELMTHLKASLVKKTNAQRTYFDGLLNGATWKTDIIGAYGIDDDPNIFRLVITSIADRESFYKQVRQLDSATRDEVTTRLDYYQINIIKDFRAHPSLRVVENISDIHITNTTSDGYQGLVWDPSIFKYTIKANVVDVSDNMDIMVGFAPSKLYDISTDNHTSCGWYLHLYDNTLISQNGNDGDAYTAEEFNVDDVITCIYDASTNEISFEKNGVSLGVAFINVNGEDIAPAVELGAAGDKVTLSIS